MNKQEYLAIQNLTYGGYCNYLKEKYGECHYTYGNKGNNRSQEGLFIHHIAEDKVPALSSAVNKKRYPEYQTPEQLVYCDYLEHLYLHILIGKETAGLKNLGLDGAFQYLVPELKSFYENNHLKPNINPNYYSVIKNDADVFNLLFEEYNKIVETTDIVLEHNSLLYPQIEKCLDTEGKALCVLGTGLGKTTTALQYIWKHKCRALVIVPNNLIKTGWEKYVDFCDVVSYQSFAKRYKTTDFSEYGLVILDEAHHAGYDEERNKGAAVWSKGIEYIINNKIIKVLGLTATPERSDDINVAETLFKGAVCEGMSVEEGIEQGIIHPFSYVTALYDTEGIVSNLKEEGAIDGLTRELQGQLDLALNNTLNVKDVFNKYLINNSDLNGNKRKGIVFIQEIEDKKYVQDIFAEVFPNMEIRAIDSKMPAAEVEENRNWFENTKEGLLLAVNMISEGAHYTGVNMIIMFRRTSSYQVYTQQLGRIITLTKDKNPQGIVFDLVNNADNVQYNSRHIEKGERKHSIGDIIKALEETSAGKSGQIIVADETRDICEVIRKIKDFNNDSWEDWELEILKTYYPTEGAEGVMNRIDEYWERLHPGALTE